ncbi:hypothetical protein A7Q10_10615 [Methylacidiphilum caldifontis]|uniref:Uncharacterized protein n=1 Tax=Methylacidiphilum caldifontis TaxID=2795386 RepID=A0A4Y8PH44_9BACT|nr:hypothetical protein A7Q10_10615 [Methylacidiphilum caldifontis]
MRASRAKRVQRMTCPIGRGNDVEAFRKDVADLGIQDNWPRWAWEQLIRTGMARHEPVHRMTCPVGRGNRVVLLEGLTNNRPLGRGNQGAVMGVGWIRTKRQK